MTFSAAAPVEVRLRSNIDRGHLIAGMRCCKAKGSPLATRMDRENVSLVVEWRGPAGRNY